jgi:hypothetical protein
VPSNTLLLMALLASISLKKSIVVKGIYRVSQIRFGVKLFSHAMKYLEGRMVGLDAVEQQVPNYIKSGFFVTRWNTRYRAVVGSSGIYLTRVLTLKRYVVYHT